MNKINRVAIEHQGRPRSYVTYHPHNNTLPETLVVMLHGAGGTAEWALDETNWLPIAEREGFSLLLPEALPQNPHKSPKFLSNPQTWNDGSRRSQTSVDDVGFIHQILAHDLPKSGFTPTQIFLTGFSNGAGMCFRLACELPDTFQAIAPVAGHIWVPGPPLQTPMATLYILGGQDPILPLHGGKVLSPWGTIDSKPTVEASLEKWRQLCGFSAEPYRTESDEHYEMQTYSSPISTAEMSVLIVRGLGHHWPGGKGKMGERLGGPNHAHIQANELIWDFFRSIPAKTELRSPT